MDGEDLIADLENEMTGLPTSDELAPLDDEEDDEEQMLLSPHQQAEEDYVLVTAGSTYHVSAGAMALIGEPAAELGAAVALHLGILSCFDEGAATWCNFALGLRDGDPALERWSGAIDLLAWSAAAVLYEGRMAAA